MSNPSLSDAIPELGIIEAYLGRFAAGLSAAPLFRLESLILGSNSLGQFLSSNVTWPSFPASSLLQPTAYRPPRLCALNLYRIGKNATHWI